MISLELSSTTYGEISSWRVVAGRGGRNEFAKCIPHGFSAWHVSLTCCAPAALNLGVFGRPPRRYPIFHATFINVGLGYADCGRPLPPIRHRDFVIFRFRGFVLKKKNRRRYPFTDFSEGCLNPSTNGLYPNGIIAVSVRVELTSVPR